MFNKIYALAILILFNLSKSIDLPFKFTRYDYYCDNWFNLYNFSVGV